MKHDNSLFKFPKSIPNDIEGFVSYYPWKFPKVVPWYEKLAKKYYSDPDGFEKFYRPLRSELRTGVGKIKRKYENDKTHSLEFLVDIDEKINKLYCYRFWIINYIFCDGPLHSFYVDKIREYIREIGVTSGVEAETEELYLKEMERILLQSDYADIYLRNALAGVEIVNILRNYQEIEKEFRSLEKFISLKNNEEIYKLIDIIIAQAERDKEKNKLAKNLISALYLPLLQVKMRKDRHPLYAAIIHDLEFYEQNRDLSSRHRRMKREIDKIFKLAKTKLSSKKYSELKTCYLMVRHLSKCKDVFGKIDLVLLPFWFQVLYEIQEKLPCSKKHKKNLVRGPGSIFYSLVWYLPPELKAKVFTPDESFFELKKKV
ncbi:MAG: hypothetical protein U9P70_00215 [Patescibacteria group bacterium]|nr:hypothetical protein [Patescibacteria group bacterium]